MDYPSRLEDAHFCKVFSPPPQRPGPIHWRVSIGDVPPEILERIFYESIEYGKTPGTSRAPIVLLRVCRLWNAITRARPELWTVLYPGHCHPNVITKFLGRSGGLPLTLWCNGASPENAAELNNRAIEILSTLLHEAHRWEQVSFDLGDAQAKNMVDNLTPGSASILTILSLDVNHCSTSVISKLGAAVALACPRIKSLSLYRISGDTCAFESFPIHKVRDITIVGRMNERNALYFIQTCKKAVSISLRALDHFYYDARSQPPKTSLPLLKSFTLSLPADPSEVLIPFTFPALESLTLKCTTKLVHRRPLTAYLYKAQFKLKRFHLFDSNQNEDDVATILRVPAVKHATDVHVRFETKPPLRLDLVKKRIRGLNAPFLTRKAHIQSYSKSNECLLDMWLEDF
ncbi:hypothetical protein D9611_001493 [Ephemerocybe angulata]|uniref:F-box domain-containing protein n=1 Tax=Ephemerocybe angulata TaxID=980116 RepID=A0A8H5CKF4_9AGAR|nr:hypothetical protein D9611_001493 [Tulosesus angulatus]